MKKKGNLNETKFKIIQKKHGDFYPTPEKLLLKYTLIITKTLFS